MQKRSVPKVKVQYQMGHQSPTEHHMKAERRFTMKKRLQANPDAPFQRIPDACRITGLSMYYLRNGCKDGTVPHVKSGTTYMVNVPELLEKLKGGAMGD